MNEAEEKTLEWAVDEFSVMREKYGDTGWFKIDREFFLVFEPPFDLEVFVNALRKRAEENGKKYSFTGVEEKGYTENYPWGHVTISWRLDPNGG